MGEAEGRGAAGVSRLFVESDDVGGMSVSLNRGGVPELRVSPSFMALVEREAGHGRAAMGRAERAALQYTRQKIDRAQAIEAGASGGARCWP